MPREGAIIFRDLVGKLEILRVECDKCGRKGQYRVDHLIEQYGIDAKLFTWSDEITADCPRKMANAAPNVRTCRRSSDRARPAPQLPRSCHRRVINLGQITASIGLEKLGPELVSDPIFLTPQSRLGWNT
jgi:hypothetical protein